MEIIDIRLKLIEDRITNPEFLKSKRIAGEVPFYIFDYSPEYELKVRKFTKELTKRVKEYYGINVIKLNLFELYMEILEDKDILNDVIEREKEIGSEELGDIMINIVEGEEIAKKIGEKAENYTLVILEGVGSVYPLIRTHSALNKLQPIFNNNDKPVLMFFPGSYSGKGLSLFNVYPSDHYYRAFKLVEDDISEKEKKEVELETQYEEMKAKERALNGDKEIKVDENINIEEIEIIELSEREAFILEKIKSSKELYERDLNTLLMKKYGKGGLISGIIKRINRKVDSETGIKEIIIHEVIGENNKYTYNG
jgi:hypothetical protein